MTIKNLTVAKCDGPGCPVEISFEADKVAKDPTALPEAMYRFLALVQMNNSKVDFCSKACLLKWSQTYKPLKSAAEMTAEIQKNKVRNPEAVGIGSVVPAPVQQLDLPVDESY
jgi:hypothetical protein